jgi:hypothetical protein
MSDLHRIQEDIELTRAALNRMVGARDGNIHHCDVTELSARLDKLIVFHARLAADQDKKRRF